MVQHIGTERPGMLGATFPRLMHILANQLFLGALIGKDAALALAITMWKWWYLPTWPAALVTGLGVSAMAWAFAIGPRPYHQFVVYAGCLLGAALKSPLVSPNVPLWLPLQCAGFAARYFFIPSLAWFLALVMLAGGRPRWPARAMLALAALGAVSAWRIPAYAPTDFAAQAVRFTAAPPGTAVTFRENPSGWSFTLVKQ